MLAVGTAAVSAAPAPGFTRLAEWLTCMRGPDLQYVNDPCLEFDLNHDQRVDLHDFSYASQVPDCGNGVVQPPEECDPPDGLYCSHSCAWLSQGTIDADACAFADPIDGAGIFRFDNSIATLDGPPHTACVNVGEDNIDRDVWGCWVSPCTAKVFAQTCGLTTVDTKIAVYDGCTCPVGDGNLLTCNDDQCDVQTIATFDAQAGASYLIRLGVFPGELGGLGFVTLSCGLAACEGNPEPCDQGHTTPGCGDQTCCETVCSLDGYCCDAEWDDTCTREAEGLCSGHFPSCAAGSGLCTEQNDTPGCEDVGCCDTVCGQDPYCCLNAWDDTCVEEEAMFCRSSCGARAGDCFTVTGNGSPGCDDPSCCAEVCVRDFYCCRIEWDATCAEAAARYCP